MARQDSRYLQVFETLHKDIAALSPNVLLPTEHDLARRFSVSRVTIRRAIGLLERSGLITRHPGRGTVVSLPKICRHLSPVISFEEDLRDQGINFETKIIEYDPRATPPPFIQTRLNIPKNQRVGFLSLVRLVEGRIICHDRHYFPPSIASRFRPSVVLGQPVPQALRDLAGMAIDSVDWETEILPAPREIAFVLGITPGVLIVLNTGTEYLQNRVPVQVNIMAYRIDRVRFKFAMRYGVPRENKGSKKFLASRKAF